MKTKTFFTLTFLGCFGAYMGFRLIKQYIHETVIYPPEILAHPYLTFNLPARDYSGGDWYMGEKVTVRFDAERPVIYVELEDGKVTQTYDYSLHLISTKNTLSYSERSKHPSGDPDISHLTPGRYSFESDASQPRWGFGGEIHDVPSNRYPRDPFRGGIFSRDIVSYSYDPSIGMKDWSIQFNGKWRNELGAYATGDNLFGMTEKHQLPLSFFTGTWTLIVQGEPIFRQRVKNLPIGADFYYSPVYGLVLLSYQGPRNKCTLYVIKTPASGPDVYRGLKEAVTVIGKRPVH